MMLLMGVPVPGGRVACRPTTSDSATIGVEGDRTVPSSVLKATMQTADPMEDVLACYRRLLIRTPGSDVPQGSKPTPFVRSFSTRNQKDGHSHFMSSP
jgi:hypothetical protein